MISKKQDSSGSDMAKIPCPHCGDTLTVTTSKQITSAVRDVYATCNNEVCLARPIMTISHKGDRTVPLNKMSDPTFMIASLLKGLNDDQKKQVFDQINLLDQAS